MHKRSAWTFASPIPLDAMIERLHGSDAVWMMRESDRYGDYVTAVLDNALLVKIYEEGDHYHLETRFRSEALDAASLYDNAIATLHQLLVTHLEAKNLVPTETDE